MNVGDQLYLMWVSILWAYLIRLEYAGFEFSKTIEIYRQANLGMVQPFDSQ